MLELKNINKVFNIGTVDETVLFNDFNFTVEDGEFVSVIGSNGSGKTTLLNLVCGTMMPESGSVIFGGKDITKLPLVKAKVGPKVMTLIADVKVFDALPLKTEVKVAVSGIYITEIKYIRGKVEPKPLTKKEQRAKANAAKKAK